MRFCVVHEGYERCACGDQFGWCENWDGILDDYQTPSCKFVDADDLDDRGSVLSRDDRGHDTEETLGV